MAFSQPAGGTISNVITKSIYDQKGDIIIASDDNTPIRLPIGENGQYLTPKEGTQSGLSWEDLPTPDDAIAAAIADHEAATTYFPSLSSSATAVYVAASGNDSTGTGASGAPWLTIRNACLAILGIRLQGAEQTVTIYIKESGTYVLPPEWGMLDNAPISTAGFETTTRTVVSSHTINTVAAATTVSGGVTVQMTDSPGWSAGTSLRKHFVQRISGGVYQGQPRPIEAASASDTIRVGGVQKWGTVQPTVPTDSGVAWANGETVDIYTPAVLLDLTGYTPAGYVGRFGQSITGCQIGTATSQSLTFQASMLQVKYCVLLANLPPRNYGELRAICCTFADAGTSIRNMSGLSSHGCVFDGVNSGAIQLENASWLNICHNNVISNGYKFQRAPSARVFNNLGSGADRTAVMFSNAPGFLLFGQTDGDTLTSGSAGPLDANGQYGPGIIAFGKLSAGEGRWLVMHGGRAFLGGSDAVYQSDGITLATVSADGGSSSTTVDISTGTHIHGHSSYTSDLTSAIGKLGMLQYETVSYAWGAAPTDTVSQPVMFPFDNAQIDAIVVAPVGAAGTGTVSAAKSPDGSGSNIFSAATFDLSTLTTNTGSSVPLTATTNDLKGSSTSGFNITMTNATVSHVVTVRFKRQAGL